MKRIKVFTVVGLLILLVLIITGCIAENDTREQVLRCNVGAPPESIDPALSTGLNEFTIQIHLWEGLTRLDQNSRPQPAAAVDWQVDDTALIYTFSLHPEARWSNGDPLTAYDFEYAWKRVLNPEVGSYYPEMLFYIKNAATYYSGEAKAAEVGVEALDDHTLRITLEEPLPYFLDLLALPVYFPVHRETVEADEEGWTLQADTAIGNGPFALASRSEDQMELVPNEYYRDHESVKLESLIFSMVANENTALTLFETGHLDVTGSIPGSEITRLKNDDALHIFPDLSIYYYIFNVEKPPLDDARVRRALAMAVDRQAIVDHLTGAGEVPAYGLIPPGITLADGRDFREAAGDHFDYDLEEAKRLLAAAGYPEGTGFPPLEILYNTSPVHKRLAEAFQEMWTRDLGLPAVTIANQDVGTYQNSLRAGEFMIARLEWAANFADPFGFFELWTSESGFNFGRWSDFEYDSLVDDLNRTASERERAELMLELEKIYIDGMPIVPVFFSSQPMMIAPGVKGYVKPSIGGIDFKTAYIAP